MTNNLARTGIIDIGSNSIRLAIYEATPEGAYRLVNENKESARLSGKINREGILEEHAILGIVPVLSQFREICEVYGCRTVRVAATAAIRNAANSVRIAERLKAETGLEIEILTGEQEAYFGFIGVAAGMETKDGFIIDIGGGSTEITLFRDRQLQHSVSLPIGAVNAQLKYGGPDPWGQADTARLQQEIERLLSEHKWLAEHPGLELIGLGGTIRTLGKLDQRRRKYPVRLAHHYRLDAESLAYYADLLPYLPLEKRKALDGLPKSRADIIVPGMILLQTVFRHTGAACCVVSGTGLREGLLMDTLGIGVPEPAEVLARQAYGLLAFHAGAPLGHFRQVSRFAERLSAVMEAGGPAPEKAAETRRLLFASSMLYKIGGAIRYHQYDKHTSYWLLHAPLGALSHREAVLCAAIVDCAAGGGKKGIDGELERLLEEGDPERIRELGSLLEIAIALDASETQSVEIKEARLQDGALLLRLKCRSRAYLETSRLEGAAKSFKKAWKLRLEWELIPSSTC
ncbi:Ppx/GppA family phosphatase [Paenibacillus sp. alder61]|uniref:Ppx/GppA family phosphatase n=1 Tax=Paenibacillus faecis TaxID=862114 RepID=A0A5D0CSC5_9BACL|nr:MULTISPECIES: Ppx/GppA phosphatase family protein [Paenibacillus]MCA1293595.1 Ppx/GppA family phosphatase [Paenibacillus sp. alder61]TYA12712.1 Ppx/GppA family phosphatase [Paenibacillus faecis]